MVIDRIEGGTAVVEVSKGELFHIPLGLIEGRVRDGATLVERDGSYVVDERATEERSRRMAEKRRRLFGK